MNSNRCLNHVSLSTIRVVHLNCSVARSSLNNFEVDGFMYEAVCTIELNREDYFSFQRRSIRSERSLLSNDAFAPTIVVIGRLGNQ